MQILQITSESDQTKMFDFCQTAISDSEMPASVNIDPTDWKNQSNTLLYTLFIQRRFDASNRAGYFLLENNGTSIASSGCYPLPNDPNICIVVARGYTIKEERAKFHHGNYLLPKQIETAMKYNYKTLLITVNEYNLWFRDGIAKFSNGGAALGKRIPKVYKGWQTLDYPVNIQYTKQWCLYKHIDESYDNTFNETMANLRTD